MPSRYSDNDIHQMIRERKPLPANFMSRIKLRSKRGHKERELEITGAQGNEFRLILRQSTFNALDFSLILAVTPPGTNLLFRLRRYNGKSHEHSNQIEGHTFYAFHIHEATERYQDLGAREDAFAQPTERFADFHSALQCILRDCCFVGPEGSQTSLFGEFDL